MTARPGVYPRWADVGGAIVTPSAGELNVGNLPGAIPTAQESNYLPNLSSVWLQYLDGVTQKGKLYPITAQSGVTPGGPTYSSSAAWSLGTSTAHLDFPLPVINMGSVGQDVIAEIVINLVKNSATGTISVELIERNYLTNTDTPVSGWAATLATASPGLSDIVLVGSGPFAARNNCGYWVQVSGGGITGDTILGGVYAINPPVYA